jgi:hypothetical protein
MLTLTPALFLFLLATLNLDLEPLPESSPFLLNGFMSGYIINGTYCQNLTGHEYCTPVTLVMDTPKNRLVFDFYNIGRKIIINNTTTYIIDYRLFSNCTIVKGWNYSTQSDAYSQLVSTPGSTQLGLAKYSGTTVDAGSCTRPVDMTLLSFDNIILQQRWIYKGAFNQFAGVALYDILTLDVVLKMNEDYFTVPNDCAEPIDYCEIMDR